MKRYVYLLWDHDEHGPETIVAASTPEALYAAAERRGMLPDSVPQLKKLLAKTAEELATTGEPGSCGGSDRRHSLHEGWGGMHLQVLEVNE